MEKHKVEMLAGAAAMFNELYSAVSVGLFRNICLWLKPVNGQRIVAAPLNGAATIFDAPIESHSIPLKWETTAEPPVNKSNLP